MYRPLIENQIGEKVPDLLSVEFEYINLLAAAYLIKFERAGTMIETPELSYDPKIAHSQIQANKSGFQIERTFHVVIDSTTEGLAIEPEIIGYVESYAATFQKMCSTEPELTKIETGFAVDHIDGIATPGKYFVRFAHI